MLTSTDLQTTIRCDKCHKESIASNDDYNDFFYKGNGLCSQTQENMNTCALIVCRKKRRRLLELIEYEH